MIYRSPAIYLVIKIIFNLILANSVSGTVKQKATAISFIQGTPPVKLSVWSSIWTTFFAIPVTPDLLHSCLHLLNFPPSNDTTLSSASIFGCTLLAIWRHHWLYVFDQVPFVSSATLSTAHTLLNRLRSEIDLDQVSI
ncbi:hypothetical protein CLU79DRAFT_734588 [Phycomyces nitens]|nr:hypothetical protein CLU79DRAFT_734588 [Phycomyces nitens]